MPKRLVLIRHAKSSWANPLQSDFDRPLNSRGLSDAPVMGGRLKTGGIMPDRIIASTARRAAQTAKLVSEGLGYDAAGIEWREELYHCVPEVFEEIIRDVDDAVQTLFIVAHNPGISDFAASLDSTRTVHHLPTCALVGIELHTDKWNDLSLAKKKLFLYDTPKQEHE